jgi:NAD(P)-dependent dehydrogenase (short-subunit alcohol dehydrogenase family)
MEINRTAVVLGAGRGIGRAIAKRLAAEARIVHVAARSFDEVLATADEIARSGGHSSAHRCDVTDDGSVRELASEVTAATGPVGVLVNCAGAHVAGSFLDLDVTSFRDLFEVNVLGAVRAMHAFLPDMLSARWGRVINVASTAGKWGSLEQSPYNTSKHALVGLTRCVALELATTGVTVNAVCPGFVTTSMLDQLITDRASRAGIARNASAAALLARVPMRRFMSPDEIAGLVAYFASEEAAGMTGQSVTLDGGMVLV